MTLLWLFAQLIFWCLAFVAILVAALVVILAPPVLAARWLWKRLVV